MRAPLFGRMLLMLSGTRIFRPPRHHQATGGISTRGYAVFVFLLIGVGLSGRSAQAACNLIPQTEKSFEAARGATTRPFAAPGEPLEVRLRPCDGATPLLGPSATDNLVTVLFEPTGSGAKHAVVLTAAADCTAVAPLLSACTAQLGAGASTQCIAGSSAAMQIVSRNGTDYLRFHFPDSTALFGTPLSGPATVAVTDSSPAALPCQLATSTCAQQSGLTACIDSFYANDGNCGRGLSEGPFKHFTALPAPNDFAAGCWDTIPPCTLSTSQFRMTTDADGNLLVPMDWRGILVRQNQVPVPRLLSATLASPVPVLGIRIPGKSFMASFTPEGGLLPPIFEPESASGTPDGVATLFGSADAPYTILRLARRSDTFQACTGGGNNGLPCNESAECPSGICGPTTCFGGARHGLACTSDGGCPGGECGPQLIDLRGVGSGGNGPLVLNRLGAGVCQEDTSNACTMAAQCSMGAGTCVGYALTAEYPVPLEGLAESPDVFAFSVNEAVDLVDRNKDGDTLDTIVTLRDRASGQNQPLGSPPLSCGTPLDTPQGRAVVRTRSAPFSFPAVVTEGDLVAFLESEANTNDPAGMVHPGCDQNGDGDAIDSVLRAFRLNSGEVGSGVQIADGDLKLNDRALAVSNGRVFFRSREAAGATRTTTRVSERTGPAETTVQSSVSGYQFSSNLSATGRFVAFASGDSGLVAGDLNGVFDIFVRDLQSGGMERVSINSLGAELNGASLWPSISADAEGRFVVFATQASNVDAGPKPTCSLPSVGPCLEVVVHDRVTHQTELVSIGPGAERPNNASLTALVSPDGRYVGFYSFASNLIDGADSNVCNSILGSGTACPDVFVRDRCTSNGSAVPGCTPSTVLATRKSDGSQLEQPPVYFSMSADGRYVAFDTSANGVTPDDDMAGTLDVFVRDLLDGSTELASTNAAGDKAAGATWVPSLSADGLLVAFQSTAGNLLPSPGVGYNIYVKDRVTGSVDRVSVSSAGESADGGSEGPLLSSNGRFVIFRSTATNLVPGDANGSVDVFVRDRVTGTTERVSLAADGSEVSDAVSSHQISADGRFVGFVSTSSSLVAGDSNVCSSDAFPLGGPCPDVFVRGIDLSDTGSDLTGDGDLDDTVLGVLDTGASASATSLCAAEQVSTVGGAAAFLRPEAAGVSNAPVCSGGSLSGPLLNGDGDGNDFVVHYVSSTNVVSNLGRAASAVILTGLCDAGTSAGDGCHADSDCPGGSCVARYVAALVSEAGEGANLNGDSDTIAEDDVAQVYDINGSSSEWVSTGSAADSLDGFGSLIVFLTPEADQGDDLNGDRDQTDRVLQLYDPSARARTNTRQAAEEFVVGDSMGDCGESPLVAFRTSEAAQAVNLNGDLNNSDYVLQVYAKGLGVANSGQAVTPCRLEACDPRQPYRVYGSKVKFLTFEVEQGADLNGDGDATDLVLQVFDACRNQSQVVSTVDINSPTAATSGTLYDPLEQDPSKEGQGVATVSKRCVQGSVTLLVPSTCTSLADCPNYATACESEVIVAAPGAEPKHDTVLQPLKPLSVRIAASGSDLLKTASIKVRNGDFPEQGGHAVQLSLEPGDCPAGVLDSTPDFDESVAGDQATTLITGGETRTAKVRLRFRDGDFAPHSSKAPQRCTMTVRATSLVLDNQDPTPRNNVQAWEINVTDASDAASLDLHESALKSASPVRITIGRNATWGSKAITVRLTNADTADGPAGHPISVSVDQGDCPAGTVSVQSTSTVFAPTGGTVRVKLNIAVASHALRAPSAKSPGRCTALLNTSTDVPANVEPDGSNNASRLIVDVVDKNQY